MGFYLITVHSILILFLISIPQKYQDYRNKQIEEAKTNKQTISSDVFFTKQTVQNACGTVAIIHALANNKNLLNIDCNLRLLSSNLFL
jgi:ubiquitin carboxyl-terminal hydrolase L3